MICSWPLHPGSRWMPNVFINSEIGSQWRTVSGHPELLSAWVSVFWVWRMDLNKRVPTLFASCEKLIWKFFPTRVGALGWPLPGFFFRDFSKKKLEGSVGQIMYREYIVFRGSNSSCSLAKAVVKMFRAMMLLISFCYCYCRGADVMWASQTADDGVTCTHPESVGHSLNPLSQNTLYDCTMKTISKTLSYHWLTKKLKIVIHQRRFSR